MTHSLIANTPAVVREAAKLIDLLESGARHHMAQDGEKLQLLAKVMREARERLSAIINAITAEKAKAFFEQAMQLLAEWKAERACLWKALDEKRKRQAEERAQAQLLIA